MKQKIPKQMKDRNIRKKVTKKYKSRRSEKTMQ